MLTHEDSKRLHMEVPIQLQQITSSTLMSSAVAYLCHFKGSMEVFHWVNSIHLYFRPYKLYFRSGGWESYRCQTFTI